MFARFHHHLAGSKKTLPDFFSAANVLLRWLSAPARRSATQSLRLLESVPLTAQASVALVRFESETLVLGVTPQNITVLAKGAVPESAASAARAG